jgi:DNA-binding PadR family transcriptional regulator
MRELRDIGQLELLLLAVVAREPLHGYGIIARLREMSGGVLGFPEGHVYPALHKLEERQAIGSHWTVVSGRRRKVYVLTDSGVELLERERQI